MRSSTACTYTGAVEVLQHNSFCTCVCAHAISVHVFNCLGEGSGCSGSEHDCTNCMGGCIKQAVVSLQRLNEGVVYNYSSLQGTVLYTSQHCSTLTDYSYLAVVTRSIEPMWSHTLDRLQYLYVHIPVLTPCTVLVNLMIFLGYYNSLFECTRWSNCYYI